MRIAAGPFEAKLNLEEKTAISIDSKTEDIAISRDLKIDASG